jgi:hypothetical protein
LRLFISVTSPISTFGCEKTRGYPPTFNANARFWHWFRAGELFSGTMFASTRSSH